MINGFPIGGFPAAPLCAIDGAEIAVFIRPFVPNFNAVVLEICDVCVSSEKPEELVNDRAQVAFFGGDQREAFGEIKTHLMAKNAVGACAGAIFFFCAIFQHVFH